MRFMLEVKGGVNVLASIAGRADVDIPVSELQKVIEVEQFLEKILGYRFHINQMATEKVLGGRP